MSCTFYSFKSGLFGGDYWCDKKDARVDNDTYYRYCRGYDYGSCPIYKQSNSSGCFITTVVCDILKKEDNDIILNNLRFFRDEVLQKNKKYYGILMDYDNIGPIIANSILIDDDCVDMASVVYNNVLLPISEFIEKGDYDRAVSKYQLMTLSLIDCYGFREYYLNMKRNDYGYSGDEFDPMTAGHGRSKIFNRG